MKLGVVGTGSVGCAIALAAVSRGSAREIVLVNRTRKTAEAVATDIRYGSVPARDVAVSPPAGAKKVDLGSPNSPDHMDKGGKDNQAPDAQGLRAVQAAAGFPVTAPDRLSGLPRTVGRLVGRQHLHHQQPPAVERRVLDRRGGVADDFADSFDFAQTVTPLTPIHTTVSEDFFKAQAPSGLPDSDL